MKIKLDFISIYRNYYLDIESRYLKSFIHLPVVGVDCSMHASIANSIDTGSFSISFFRKTVTREPLTLPDAMLSDSVAGTSSGYR